MRHLFPFVFLLLPFTTTILEAQEKPTIALELPSPDGTFDLPEYDSTFPGLVIEDMITTESHPLVPYIFFDSGSSRIPDRYMVLNSPEEAQGYFDTASVGGTLQWYYQLLNIIGFRMQQYPDTKVWVAGYISSSIHDFLGEDKTLCESRAQRVYDYLTTIWQIDSARINLLPVNYGPPPTRISSFDVNSIPEQARTEIRSEDWEIMKPVLMRKLRRYTLPFTAEFRLTNGIPDSLVERREIRIFWKGEEWHRMTDFGRTQPYSPEWNWHRQGKDELPIPDEELPYTAQLIVVDREGKEHRSDELEIPVLLRTMEKKQKAKLPDRTISRYSLVLFKFDSQEPVPLNERILKEYIYSGIDTGAKVRVIGYTDMVGLEDRNLKLSQDRAQKISGLLQTHAADTAISSLKTEGVGETQPIYSNDLPEGRFYNRTVQIVIEAPAKDE